MSQPVRCTNCGATMAPAPDGRVFVCAHCGAQTQVAIDGQQIAAGLRLDLASADVFLAELASALHHGFAERAKIHRDGGAVVLVELALEGDVFIARREAHGVTAQHKKVVRGIALKTATHPLDRWVELLAKAIAAHANSNARAAEALARLRGG
jgi:hypothetical protein